MILLSEILLFVFVISCIAGFFTWLVSRDELYLKIAIVCFCCLICYVLGYAFAMGRALDKGGAHYEQIVDETGYITNKFVWGPKK